MNRFAQAAEKSAAKRCRKFWDQRHEEIEREKRALLLPKPGADLRMGPPRPVRESRAEMLALELVQRRHKLELQELDGEAGRQLDEFLRERQQAQERAQTGKDFRENARDATAPKLSNILRRVKDRDEERER